MRRRARRAATWPWEEFLALPAEEITVDIHCVTKWTKLDTSWQGRLDRHAARRQVETEAEYVTALSDGGYTTNLPLEDVTGGQGVGRLRVRRRAAGTRARRSGAAARPAPLLLEERQVGARADAHRSRTSPASGRATATTTAATHGGNSATRATDLAARAAAVEHRDETPRCRSICSRCPSWRGHRAGQHVDVRLTARGWLPGAAQLLDRVGARRPRCSC